MKAQEKNKGIVGKLWRIKNPNTIRIADSFLKGRLKEGDLFLCVEHFGDFFQQYSYVWEFETSLVGCRTKMGFGSYGIGDAEEVNLKDGEFEILRDGGRVEIEGRKITNDAEVRDEMCKL